MITAIVIVIVAAISFALGMAMSSIRARRRINKAVDSYLGSEDWAYEEYADILAFECPEHHAPAGELCNFEGTWVCLERVKFVEDIRSRGYDYVVSSTAMPPSPGDWIEFEIQNECGHGCKIYRNTKTGVKILWHNSAYGCTL